MINLYIHIYIYIYLMIEQIECVFLPRHVAPQTSRQRHGCRLLPSSAASQRKMYKADASRSRWAMFSIDHGRFNQEDISISGVGIDVPLCFTSPNYWVYNLQHIFQVLGLMSQ